jgi:hypothetical protein
MSDFSARISKSVQEARALAQQLREAQRQQEESLANAHQQSQRRAAELATLIWEQIGVAERASNGAIAAERSNSSSRTSFQVQWKDSQPARSLQITVDEADGTIQASWIMPAGYGRSVDSPRIGATEFDISKLEAVILLLIDERRWAGGALPMIPW